MALHAALEEAFKAQCADLKPLLTQEFCETLVQAARTFAWGSSDYGVLIDFVHECLDLAGQSVLIDLTPYIQQV